MNKKNIYICILSVLIVYFTCIYIKYWNHNNKKEQSLKKLYHQFDIQAETTCINKDQHVKQDNPSKQKYETKVHCPEINNTYGTNLNMNHNKNNREILEDCILQIPKISLEEIVYTGKKRVEKLNQNHIITSTDDMYYINGGNYIICGHNSRIYGAAFSRIKELEKNDKIIIFYNGGKHVYSVEEVCFESMNQTQKYCIQTKDRRLTILSCAKYIAKDKYIIVNCRFIDK